MHTGIRLQRQSRVAPCNSPLVFEMASALPQVQAMCVVGCLPGGVKALTEAVPHAAAAGRRTHQCR